MLVAKVYSHSSSGISSLVGYLIRGVADQDVDPAELVGGLPDDAPAVFLSGHVTGVSIALWPAGNPTRLSTVVMPSAK